jgi:ferrochelatase
MVKRNIAVVLFNIGGPEKLDQVRSYLFNFFSDKFIIRAPFLIRKLIAFLISTFRSSKTKSIYSQIGGKSLSSMNALNQSNKLEEILNQNNDIFSYKTYICMSYWGMTREKTMMNIFNDNQELKFEKIIYLPLYPQFSTTTTLSSFFYFQKELSKKKFIDLKNSIKQKFICCYFQEPSFIDAHCDLLSIKIKEAFELFEEKKDEENINSIRILFSAHSIPEKLTYSKEKNGQGDPYKFQIEQTVNEIMKKINTKFNTIDYFDYKISYQSKIGPVKWLEPSTENEIIECYKQRIMPIIVPIAFTSDNSETLYELDIEYKDLLNSNGMKYFFRSDALNINDKFIFSLKNMVEKANKDESDENFINSYDNVEKKEYHCPCSEDFFSCPKRKNKIQ